MRPDVKYHALGKSINNNNNNPDRQPPLPMFIQYGNFTFVGCILNRMVRVPQ